jgi:hypothetical protein
MHSHLSLLLRLVYWIDQRAREDRKVDLLDLSDLADFLTTQSAEGLISEQELGQLVMYLQRWFRE